MLLTLLATLSGDVWAGRPALDPEIKLHAGTSLVKGTPSQSLSGLGLMAGMDSRLTRFVYVDMGGFVSPVSLSPTAGNEIDSETPGDYFRLRSSIFILPGFRIPHRQPTGWSWDVTLRLGPSVVWSADLTPNDPRTTPNTQPFPEIDTATTTGLDVHAMGEHLGVRASWKLFVLTPFYEEKWREVLFQGHQMGAEVFWEF